MPDISDINLNDVQPAGDFEPIPAGWYKAIVDSSETKETKAGTGQYIELRLTILGPKFEGRLLFDRLNLWNPNQEAVEIAKRQLKALTEAAGKPTAKATEELHGIPIEVKVAIRPARGDYGASNDVKSYRPAQKSAPRAVSTSAPRATSANTPPAGVPWGGQG